MIRSGGLGDLDALYELEVACFAERRFTREHLMYLLRNPRSSTFVYEIDRVLGAIMLHDEDGVLRVLSVGVHPAFRRRGIGRRLMALAEDIAAKFGSRELRLEVSTQNEGAIAFYAYAMRKPIAISVRKS
jgi:ribosomal protein S18 acetylase RimI-like enzyme